MEKSTKSSLPKSASTRSTPQKRKHDSVGGSHKKLKLDLSYVEEECKKTFIEHVPSIIMSMGCGDTGQLGLGEDVLEKKRPGIISGLNDIIEIRAGGMHSICLSRSGKVFTFGCNDEGALGRTIVEDEEATVPGEVSLPQNVTVVDITAGDNHSSVLTEDGRVYIWGSFRDNNGLIGLLKPFEKLLVPTLIPVDKKIIKIASGENHFAMLTEQGDILTLGVAEQGQLGRVSPNNLIRGGRGGLLPLLIPGPVRVRHSVKFCDIWAGSFCTVGKSIDGEIYGCGLNNYKQLGIADDLLQLMMVNLEEFNKLKETWKKFVFGQHHTMALTGSNKIYVIGRGEYGNLGQGDNEHRQEVTRVNLQSDDILTIAACNRTSYALLNDGSIFSWGMGSSYQLGHGDDEDVNVPTKMVGKLVTEKKVIEISPGFQHVLFRAVSRETQINEEVENKQENENNETVDNSEETSKTVEENEGKIELAAPIVVEAEKIEDPISEVKISPNKNLDMVIEEDSECLKGPNEEIETGNNEIIKSDENAIETEDVVNNEKMEIDDIVTNTDDIVINTDDIVTNTNDAVAPAATEEPEKNEISEPVINTHDVDVVASNTDDVEKNEINDSNNNQLEQMDVEEQNQES